MNATKSLLTLTLLAIIQYATPASANWGFDGKWAGDHIELLTGQIPTHVRIARVHDDENGNAIDSNAYTDTTYIAYVTDTYKIWVIELDNDPNNLINATPGMLVDLKGQDSQTNKFVYRAVKELEIDVNAAGDVVIGFSYLLDHSWDHTNIHGGQWGERETYQVQGYIYKPNAGSWITDSGDFGNPSGPMNLSVEEPYHFADYSPGVDSTADYSFGPMTRDFDIRLKEPDTNGHTEIVAAYCSSWLKVVNEVGKFPWQDSWYGTISDASNYLEAPGEFDVLPQDDDPTNLVSTENDPDLFDLPEMALLTHYVHTIDLELADDESPLIMAAVERLPSYAGEVVSVTSNSTVLVGEVPFLTASDPLTTGTDWKTVDSNTHNLPFNSSPSDMELEVTSSGMTIHVAYDSMVTPHVQYWTVPWTSSGGLGTPAFQSEIQSSAGNGNSYLGSLILDRSGLTESGGNGKVQFLIHNDDGRIDHAYNSTRKNILTSLNSGYTLPVDTGFINYGSGMPSLLWVGGGPGNHKIYMTTGPNFVVKINKYDWDGALEIGNAYVPDGTSGNIHTITNTSFAFLRWAPSGWSPLIGSLFSNLIPSRTYNWKVQIDDYSPIVHDTATKSITTPITSPKYGTYYGNPFVVSLHSTVEPGGCGASPLYSGVWPASFGYALLPLGAALMTLMGWSLFRRRKNS